jgi:hypothetical protein
MFYLGYVTRGFKHPAPVHYDDHGHYHEEEIQ